MRHILCIFMVAIIILCRTQATSIFPGAEIQNRSLLKDATAPRRTKFPFRLYGNQERVPWMAEYQTCMKFSLVLTSKCTYMDGWLNSAALFSLQAFLTRDAVKEIHIQYTKCQKFPQHWVFPRDWELAQDAIILLKSINLRSFVKESCLLALLGKGKKPCVVKQSEWKYRRPDSTYS